MSQKLDWNYDYVERRRSGSGTHPCQISSSVRAYPPRNKFGFLLVSGCCFVIAAFLALDAGYLDPIFKLFIETF